MKQADQSDKERGEIALVRRAQAGDAEAFDSLARHYRALLRALAFLRTSDLHETEDLTQEVLTRAWQKLPLLQDPTAFLPWLKMIVANACNSWYRRSRTRPASLEEESMNRSLLATEEMPLQALLAQERQRELRQALVTLPYANRLALLMHIWGGYSYEEIAQFANVPITTVEGRIHRAKQQLRRLLYEEAASFLGEPHKPWKNHKESHLERPRTPTMTKTLPSPISKELAQSFALVQFTHRFSALVDAGFSLVRTLLILEEISPSYGEAAHTIRLEIEAGDTISNAMSRSPHLFTPFYILLIRAGEVGGILEETLRRAANLVSTEWKLIFRNPDKEDPLFLISPFSKPLPSDWAALSPYQQTTTLILFCETYGLLLRSGVPILQTMETISALLPQTQRAGMLAAREAAKQGKPILQAMEPMGMFPRVILELIDRGEQEGNLDLMLERGAEIFQHELDCWLMAEELSPILPG